MLQNPFDPEIQVGVGDPVMDIGQVCPPLYLGLTLKLPSFMVAQTASNLMNECCVHCGRAINSEASLQTEGLKFIKIGRMQVMYLPYTSHCDQRDGCHCLA